MLEKLNIGGYPREYDPVRHGTYDPARYYGKRESVSQIYSFSFNQDQNRMIILYNERFVM